MMVRNNVNLEALKGTAEAIKNGKSPEKKVFSVSGEWVYDSYQFKANLGFEGGTIEVRTDQPTAAGGRGNAPNPVQYCVFAMVACYSTTFMTIAAQRGVDIRSLKARGYSRVNMRAVFNLEDAPVVEEVGIELEVESDAPAEVLDEIRREADRKCPAAYTVANSVPFRSNVKVHGG